MKGRGRSSPESALWRDLDLRWTRIVGAVLVGSAALGSAVGLAATSAWLIARAAEMPSPADLALAAVFVRALGIGRGILRYLERLTSHDIALRGVSSLRVRTYERLESGGAARVVTLPRETIVSRLGSDLDALGDAVVRALVPVGVAIVVSLTSVAIVGSQHRGAAACLAVGLVLAAVGPILLSSRAFRLSQEEGAEAEAEVVAATLSAMEGAIEHRIWGRTHEATAFLDAANRRLERARDAAARPTALAAAVQVLSAGAALVFAIAIAVAVVSAGTLTGPAGAVVALTPLAAFEAVGALPAATTQAHRSRTAARRVWGLLQSTDLPAPRASKPKPKPAPARGLDLDGVSAAWPGAVPTRPVTAWVPEGSILGVVGPSGGGKTALLLTIAGALGPASGRVLFEGRVITQEDTGRTIAMTAEDAHVFGTTVLENLRVARGDVTEEEALHTLAIVGLGPWLTHQTAGLDTLLGSGGLSVSGGERRRLLLARALLHPAPIHLVDEPAEHLDEAGADVVRVVLRRMASEGKVVIIVTHDRAILDVVDTVVDLGG